MFYSMLFGTLPYFSEDEKEIVDKILHAPLKFPPKVPVTNEAKEIIKSMLNKDPTKRAALLDIMNTQYYVREDEEFE